jgi:uncharacterized protein with HEPN domain
VPPRSWRFRVQDILDAIAAIESYTTDMDYDAFAADRRTIDAVIRNIEIIGEAARHLPAEARLRAPDVPWADITGMRNLLAHGYFVVDVQIVWRTIRDDLPSFAPALLTMLEQAGPESDEA